MTMNSEPKPVCQYSLAGELIAEFPSIKAAARACGIPIPNIADAASRIVRKMGKYEARYLTAGGFAWAYKSEAFESDKRTRKPVGKPATPVVLSKGDETLAFLSSSDAGRYLMAKGLITHKTYVATALGRGHRVAGYTVTRL